MIKTHGIKFFDFFFSFFFIGYLCIYISNVIPFPRFPSGTHLSHPPSPCFFEGALPATQPLTPHCPGIPLNWGIELPLLVPDNAILCYICSWSHGSLHMYSLVGGLVPESSGGLVGSYGCSSCGTANASAPSVLSLAPPLGDLVLSPMVVSKWQNLQPLLRLNVCCM